MNRLPFALAVSDKSSSAEARNSIPAPCHRHAYCEKFCQANPLFGFLVVRNTNSDPFLDPFDSVEIPRMARMLSTLRMRIDNPRARDEACTALCIFEIPARSVAEGQFKPQDDCRWILVNRQLFYIAANRQELASIRENKA